MALVDRLAEIKGDSGGDLESQPLTDGDMVEPYLGPFLQTVAVIKASMTIIRSHIHAIQEKSGQLLTAVTTQQGAQTGSDLEELIEATTKEGNRVRDWLKTMAKENEDLIKQGKKNTAEYRIRANMHVTLTKKFVELMNDAQVVQTNYKKKYKDRIKRQLEIVQPDATPEQIDEAVASGNAGQIFAGQILDKRYHTEAQDALNYINQKHREILKLETSINELHQLFLDMAVMVEAQGDLINVIEHNVEEAMGYTQQGTVALRSANKLAKKSRKKMMFIVCCCICIIFIVALAVGIPLGLGKS